MGLPEGKWDFYQCWDEGNTRSTFVDLDASQYRAELPECLTLTLHLRFPNVNNGMTTPEEAKVLNAAEDLVADDLKSEVRARFVGRVTRDGLRIFYDKGLSDDDDELRLLISELALNPAAVNIGEARICGPRSCSCGCAASSARWPTLPRARSASLRSAAPSSRPSSPASPRGRWGAS